MKKLLCLFLVFAMLISLLSGCTPSQLNTLLPKETSTTATEETTPSLPEDRELVVNQAQLEYTLTPADVEKFEQLLADFEIAAISLTDPEEIDRLYTELEDQYDFLDGQSSIATVLYYSDLSDTDAQARYLSATKTLTEANDTYLVTMRRIYNGEYAAKEIIFEDWSEADIRNLLSYTQEVMQLRQRNTEIDAAYQDLQSDPEMYAKMIPLYTEFVQNNNRLANIYGYGNYYEYAYKDGYTRDYGEEQVAQMRSYAAQYLIPALEGALAKFSAAYQVLTEEEQLLMAQYEYSLFTDWEQPYLEDYLDVLPAGTRNTMLDMFDGDILLLEEQPSAMEGAFTTALSPDRALCFFGPGCGDTLTVIHEAGHYYACQHTYLSDIPLDLAEVHSQGNEWLFTAFLEGRLSKNLYEAIVNYKMFNDLAIVLIALAVDAFEYKVYTHPDPGSLTAGQLDQMMEEVCVQFGGIKYVSENLTNIQNYWRMVVIEQPVYYVSYAVSALASMELYSLAQQNFDQAVEYYVNLAEDLDPEKGFLSNLQSVGISGPFDEDVYKQLHTILTQ